jgi:myosin heavy subunit
MENTKQKTAIYAGAIVIALLLIGMIFTSLSISKAKRTINGEKQNSEKLLSQKLSTEKELSKLQADFSSLKQKSDSNQKLLNEMKIKIADNEKKLRLISSENRSLRSYRKELDELKKVKADLDKEAYQLKSDYDKLMDQNKDLQNSLSALESEKKILALQLENALKLKTDNFLVTATRGKEAERIVIKASRTKKLNMTFEVPQSLTEAISFNIVTPSGATVKPDDKSLSWTSPMDSRNFTASLSAMTGEFEQSRQVVLNYMPKGKLENGEYKIHILCNGKNIGNCRITLR